MNITKTTSVINIVKNIVVFNRAIPAIAYVNLLRDAFRKVQLARWYKDGAANP